MPCIEITQIIELRIYKITTSIFGLQIHFTNMIVDEFSGYMFLEECTMTMTWFLDCFHFWVVVSNMFYFHPYLGKISILTNIFQRG